MVINQKGVIQLFVPAAVLILLVLGVTASSITTTTNFPASPQVLGENEAAKKAAEQAKEAAQKKAEQIKESSNIKVQIQTEGNKKEIEAETSTGQKIKVKVEDDGAGKIEIEQNKQKLKYELEDENEASESAEVQQLRSISKFPLRIDPSTNQLIMTKNGVERVLTVLPTKAVQNMLRAHLKKGLGPKFFEDATSSATPSGTTTEEPTTTESAGVTVLEDQISLEETDGQIAYKIPAIKKIKIFGIIPVNTNFNSFVSAETGTLIKEQQSLLSKILNFLSP